ncbi:hypothetical protein DPMN_065197 [Dreissena polymorpha]|uniref:Uncharacterized protein n=1 Tax=Dreissena polymorpha TaxID=45954 RepID=A0A9D4HMW5_DREPO|nr:hypothetical protein DPMN_065197 [Dreissena polymorpha]
MWTEYCNDIIAIRCNHTPVSFRTIQDQSDDESSFILKADVKEVVRSLKAGTISLLN